MADLRIRKAESRFGPRFGPLWSIPREALPSWARLESTPTDPGLDPRKQNHYLFTVQPVMLARLSPALCSVFHTPLSDARFRILLAVPLFPPCLPSHLLLPSCCSCFFLFFFFSFF